MTQELVVTTQNHATTTSRIVASRFDKRHDNVLRDIEKLRKELPDEWMLLNFEEHGYVDGRGNTQKEYRITRDGFALLAMGFTGAAALQWKIRFLDAFNKMERALTSPAVAPFQPPRLEYQDAEQSLHRLRERESGVLTTRLRHAVMHGIDPELALRNSDSAYLRAIAHTGVALLTCH